MATTRKQGAALRGTCSSCGREFPRSRLSSKRVEWTTIGKVFKRLRQRTIAWQCRQCREADPDWNRQPMLDTPAMQQQREAKAS